MSLTAGLTGKKGGNTTEPVNPIVYQHTQQPLMLRVIYGALLVFAVAGMALAPDKDTATIFMITFFIVGFVVATFGSLTVTVDKEFIHLKFGMGLIRKRIYRSWLKKTEVVRNPWWTGFGIRYIGGGNWMFNVRGFDAVELTYKDGKKFRIGTDEPGKLLAALK
ncbi:MAG: hypothetical protein KTR14_01290 [Vampirovibrio sp.]|nr:hypothetical protein [Vampirovibrio sp.]